MKLVSLQVDNYHIEVHNNYWTGIETVYVNGQQVCRQFNWFNGVHQFSLPASDGFNQDHYRIDFSTNFFKWTMIDIDVFRNGECLLNQSGKAHRVYHHYAPAVGARRQPAQQLPPAERLELRQLERQPLYREEDLV